VKTFSIGFEDPKLDESAAALRVARHLGTDHRSIVMPSPGADDLRAIVGRTDQPLADPAIVPTWYLSKLAREGVTVALSGEGADEVFGGYHWYRRRGGASPGGDATFDPLAAALYARREQVPRELRRSLIAREIAGVGDRLTQDAARNSYLAAGSSNGSLPPIASLQAIDFRSVLGDDLLVKADRMSMAWSLEVRCPYLDHRIIEAVLPGPDRWKIRWGRRKALLKAVGLRHLPREVVLRKKHGFMIPIDALLRGKLAAMLGDMTTPARLKRHGLLDPDGVAALLGRWREEPALAKTVWKVLCLQTWMEGHGGANG
jgi:asparagine synthase (glutamine-hydrolysing)